MRRRFAVGLSYGVLALLLCATPGATQAQVAKGSLGQVDDDDENATFLSRLGLVAERVALEQGGDARRRALRRMFTLAQHAPQPVAEVLDEWLTARPKLEALDTWLVTRTLTQLQQVPAARRYLVDALAGEQLSVETDDDFATSVPRTAALALAKSKAPEALKLLGEWLRRPGERARWAQAALLTHRPPRISPLLSSSGPATVVLVQTLGALGDPAAIPFLRRVVKRSTAEVQGAAAVALARLGVRETQDLAALWLGRSDTPTVLLGASVWIYLQFRHPQSGAAFVELLERDAAEALLVAEHSAPNVSTTPLLADHFAALTTIELQRRALGVLARAGADGVPPLLRLFRSEAKLRWDVAASLAEVASPAAADGLWTFLGTEDLRAPALSALVAHNVLHREASSREALVSELQRWSGGPPSGTREAARMGLAALDETLARRFLATDEVSLIGAAALASSVHGGAYRKACVDRLHQLAHPMGSKQLQVSLQTLAASSALSHVGARDSLSLRLLRVLASFEAPLQDVARWHFRARHVPDFAPSAAPDPSPITAEEAGNDLEPWPARDVSLALERLQLEPRAERRAAWLAGLFPHRASSAVRHVIAWHSDFDPEGWVRTLASTRRDVPVRRRAVWTAPPTPAAPSDPYWVTVTHPLRLPVALFVPHGHPTVVFVEGIPKLPPSETSYLTAPEGVGISAEANFPRVDILDHPSRSTTP